MIKSTVLHIRIVTLSLIPGTYTLRMAIISYKLSTLYAILFQYEFAYCQSLLCTHPFHVMHAQTDRQRGGEAEGEGERERQTSTSLPKKSL